MREGHQVLLLRRAVLHVSEISNGDMPNVVLSSTAGSITTEVADRRQALGISFPGLPRSHQFAHYVVRRNREARWRITVVVGQHLAGGEHQVVANRWVGIGVILRGQSVLTHQPR